MSLAEWILVEKHRMGSFSDLLFTIFFIFFVLFHLFFCNDFFVLKVDVEQDLCFIFFKQICVRATTLEYLQRAVQLALEQVVDLPRLRSIGILVRVCIILAEEDLRSILTITFFDEEPVDILVKQKHYDRIMAAKRTPLLCANN